jgi:hypothetical protein
MKRIVSKVNLEMNPKVVLDCRPSTVFGGSAFIQRLLDQRVTLKNVFLLEGGQSALAVSMFRGQLLVQMFKVDPLVRTPIFRKAFRCGDWRNSTGLA